MRRLIAFTLIALMTFAGSAAQQAASYLVRGIGSQITGGQVVVDFTVLNSGASVTTDETVRLFDSQGNVLATQIVKPLAATQSRQMLLTIPLSAFTPGSSETLYVAIGIDQLPQAQSQREQFSNITVFIPQQAAEAAPPGGAPSPSQTVTLPGGYTLNFTDPTSIALVLGVVVVVIVLLWVLTVITRMLFSRPATLPAWQPPYVVTPLIDPNSTNGRRQLWQQHAQSDTLPGPCVPGNYMVRKLLIGSSGAKLAGWRVTGLRVSQYDRYGRVARSTAVMSGKTVRALDRAARKSPSLDWERAQRMVRPVARALTESLVKKTNAQNAILPVAIDIRFAGMHGEVRILFELYGCNGSAWQEIDQWEPEMRVVNGSIHENFTYTLLGQYPDEPRKQFRRRLEAELTGLLAAMVQQPPPSTAAQDTAETAAVQA
jgi:hypothetical protein